MERQTKRLAGENTILPTRAPNSFKRMLGAGPFGYSRSFPVEPRTRDACHKNEREIRRNR